MQGQRYDSPAGRAQTVAQLVHGIRALPEIQSVSATTYTPATSCCSQFGVTIAGRPQSPERTFMVTGNIVTPGFFSTLRIPLLAGRDFTDADVEGAPRVVIIGETFAKQYWPDGDALGHLIDTGGGGMSAIVGIVGDIKQGHIIDAPEPQFYRPYAQDSWPSMAFVVRTRTSAIPASLAQDVRRAAHDIDPIALPIGRPRGLQEQIDATISPRALFGRLLTAFAAIALGLAAIGVYAIMSFFVAQRTRELGLRVALGANRGRVLSLVLRETATMSVVGGGVGLVVGMFAARLLTNSLFGVTAGEISVYVVAAMALALAAFGASAVPAWRAARVDPMIALRSE
jgi:predicted permease